MYTPSLVASEVEVERSGTEKGTVLVTGGTGYLAGWCLIELLRRGYAVRTTVRDPSREPELRARLEPHVETGRLAVLAADLSSDDHWPKAAEGCDYVLHVASPFPPVQPSDPDELIVPAREGTRRVLEASLQAGVRRVVVTSSVAAIRGRTAGQPLTEADWTDPDDTTLTPYGKSKTIAERAAWDLVEERGESDRLAVVNPGAILGPLISDDRSYSLEMVERLLKGMPGVPRIGFSIVDVRDVAELEIEAMTSPEAGGKRFIAVDRFLWMADVAAVLRDRLGEGAAKVPRRTIPNLMVRAMAIFDPGVRAIVGQLGKKGEFSNERARSVLGWSPRPAEETVTECAQSMIDRRIPGGGD